MKLRFWLFMHWLNGWLLALTLVDFVAASMVDINDKRMHRQELTPLERRLMGVHYSRIFGAASARLARRYRRSTLQLSELCWGKKVLPRTTDAAVMEFYAKWFDGVQPIAGGRTQADLQAFYNAAFNKRREGLVVV